MTDDMTAEQAVEILNRRKHEGDRWELRAWSGVRMRSLMEIKAIARDYLRQEAAETDDEAEADDGTEAGE